MSRSEYRSHHDAESSVDDSFHALPAGRKGPNANTISGKMFPSEPDGVVFSMDDIAQLIAAVKKERRIIVRTLFKAITTHAGNGHIGPEDDRSDLGRGVFAHGCVDLT